MPHLSPINWPIAFISFWLLLSTFFSLIWWLQTPKFPKLLPPTPTNPQKPWPWK